LVWVGFFFVVSNLFHQNKFQIWGGRYKKKKKTYTI
jgi:hypothetical protein